MDSAIGYGRVSTPDQAKKNRFQRQVEAIKTAFNIETMDFDYDETSKKSNFEQRTSLHRQLRKAASNSVPLLVEHSDRLFKSYDEHTINSFLQGIGQYKITIKFAHSNVRFHNRISKIICSTNFSSRKKHHRLVRLVDQYLQHRHLIIFPHGNSDELPPLHPFRSLKRQRYFPALTRCADHLLELDPFTDSPLFAFTLDAYLGAAYNHKSALVSRNGTKFAPGGQRTYGENPEHFVLFGAIQDLEAVPLFTAAGRPKRMSDAIVARALDERGFANFRGNPFSRKSVWQIRSNPAYLRFVSFGPALPNLPVFS